MQLINNAYGKNHDIQGLFKKSEVMYLNPDKKRTNSWMQGLGLQLPSDTNSYGSIGTITYDGTYVKLSGISNRELINPSKETGQGILIIGNGAVLENDPVKA